MMKTRSLWLWLWLALLAPGCANVGPDFQKPEADVNASWLSVGDANVDAEATPPEAWWGVFGDATLTALIEEAFNQNLTVEIAGLRIMEARAQLGYAVGLKYPQSQSVGGGYSRSRSSKNAPPLGNLPDDVVNGAKTEVDVYSMSFDAAWEADVWGKFRRGIEAADANLATRMLDYDAVLVTLAGDVAALYTTIRTYERLAYARANIQLQRESLSLAESRFRLGATSQLDVEQAKAQLYNTEAVIPGLEIGLGRSRLVLSTLLGKPPATLEDSVGASGTIPGAPTSVAVGMPAELLRRRPDVRAAEMATAVQSAAIGIRQADLYPHFVLAGSFGLAAESFSDQFESDSRTGFLSPFLSWDIFNYGRIKNQVRAQDARFEQSVVAYQSTVLNAAREVEDGLLVFLKSQERTGYLDQAVAASEKATKLALVQYRNGAADYTRVLNTQTALMLQQDQLTRSQGQVVSSLVATYKALGGGWQVRQDGYLNAETKARMKQRSDWGGMLEDN